MSINLTNHLANVAGSIVTLVSLIADDNGQVEFINRAGQRGAIARELIRFSYDVSTPVSASSADGEWRDTGADHDAEVAAAIAEFAALGYEAVVVDGGAGDGGDVHYANSRLSVVGLPLSLREAQAMLDAKCEARVASMIEASGGRYYTAEDWESGADAGFLLADAAGEPSAVYLFSDLPEGVTECIGHVVMSVAGGEVLKVERHEPPAPIRAIVVGRHAGEIPGVEVIEQRNIEWSLDFDECDQQWRQLFLDANAIDFGAAIVLQNVPGILAAVLMARARRRGVAGNSAVYVIISRRGPGLADVSKTFTFGSDPDSVYYREMLLDWQMTLVEAVRHANGRAKVEVAPGAVTVTVDPVSPFEFVRLQRVW